MLNLKVTQVYRPEVDAFLVYIFLNTRYPVKHNSSVSTLNYKF